jgi:hypothetical protein
MPKLHTLPPIFINELRLKALCLIDLHNAPVHFTFNGIATANECEAMVTFALDSQYQMIETWWV